MLPPYLSPKSLLEHTAHPDAEYFSYAHVHFPSLVHAIRVDHGNARAIWSDLRTQFESSGYWPVVVSFINSGPPGVWREMVAAEAENMFSRFYFKEEVDFHLPGMRSVEPASILEAANVADPMKAIETHDSQMNGISQDHTEWICDFLQRTYGEGPSIGYLVSNSSGTSAGALQQTAFDWLIAQGLDLAKTDDPFWYEPSDPLAILLLPLRSPSDTLAHIHWWGCHTLGTPSTIKLMREWNIKYGAELMCHYGTVLQLNIRRPITSPQEAFAVASQMETICMQNNAIESAAQIMGARHWHMHNRP
jgi:hypothetical protein